MFLFPSFICLFFTFTPLFSNLLPILLLTVLENKNKKTVNYLLTNYTCFLLPSELQNLISSNERRMSELKQISIQLQQRCSEPCQDSVEIQPTTGTGKKKLSVSVTFGPFLFHKKFLNPAMRAPFVLVQCLVRE